MRRGGSRRSYARCPSSHRHTRRVVDIKAFRALAPPSLRASSQAIYEARLFPDLEYTLKHALTHEVTYVTVLQERRRALHARLVEALERVHENRLDEHVEALAHHAFLGEVWDRAVRYLRHAGTRAGRQ